MNPANTATPTAVTTTDDGPVRGIIKSGMNCFLGIPFAAPPTGDLRWRPPVRPTPWAQPYEAVEFGPVCAQDTTCFPGFGFTSDTEDCLYLNVFTQAGHDSMSPLPVMVWFPGGGLFIGGSTGYDPGGLVAQGDVVVVSVNYRLNVFGFFSHPAINAEDHAAGNYGLLDQQFALQWVQRNISAFGGDPGNVTIFGESAGGQTVVAHLASPASGGLFHKAIIQSGSTTATIDLPNLSGTEQVGIALAAAAGCSSENAADLRAIPTATLVAANAMPPGVFGVGQFQIGLVEDGVVLPEGIRHRFVNGDFNKVPLINGVNHDEFTWFLAMMELVTGQSLEGAPYGDVVGPMLANIAQWGLLGAEVPPTAMAEVIERYPLDAYPGVTNAIAAVIGDGIITAMHRTTRVIQTHQAEVFAYEFDVPDSPVPWSPVSFPYQSGHTQELQYLFPGFHGGSGSPSELTGNHRQLATQMVRYWTDFARTGSPSPATSSSPVWRRYDPEVANVMVLAASQQGETESWGRRHHTEFWDSRYTGK